MRSASLYTVGGNALLAGAILFAVGMVLHAPQPADLTAYRMIPMSPWMLAHWMFALGAVLSAGGLVALARHLFRTEGEGWAVLGLGANIVTAGLFVAITAPEIAAFPMLGQMGSSDVGAQHAFTAINLNLMSLVHVGMPLFWGGIVCYALAMLRDSAFPRWLAQTGVVLGVVEVVAGFALAENWMLFKIVVVVGYAWVAATGVMMARIRPAPAR